MKSFHFLRGCSFSCKIMGTRRREGAKKYRRVLSVLLLLKKNREKHFLTGWGTKALATSPLYWLFRCAFAGQFFFACKKHFLLQKVRGAKKYNRKQHYADAFQLAILAGGRFPQTSMHHFILRKV